LLALEAFSGLLGFTGFFTYFDLASALLSLTGLRDDSFFVGFLGDSLISGSSYLISSLIGLLFLGEGAFLPFFVDYFSLIATGWITGSSSSYYY
jgi:hypothetical protein